jgi:hypothetical protein
MLFNWHGESMAAASEYKRAVFEEHAARVAGALGRAVEANAGTRMLPGEKRFRDVMDALENRLCWVRHKFQREFHMRCMASLAKYIIGDDWGACGERICREFGFDTDVSICAAAGPRRFGKSVAVGGLGAAVAVFGPAKSRQGIFSTGRRASKYLGELIYTTLVSSGFKHMITVYNQEELWVVPDREKPDDIRKIFYFPSSSQVCHARIASFLFSSVVVVVKRARDFRFSRPAVVRRRRRRCCCCRWKRAHTVRIQTLSVHRRRRCWQRCWQVSHVACVLRRRR